MRRAKAAVAATILAGLLLTGCGSGSDDHSGSKSSQGDKGSVGSASLTKLAVPSAYASDQGWDQDLSWVPQGAAADPVATDGEAVVYVVQSGDGYAVQVRDAATGKMRWTSAPYQVPAVITEPSNFGYSDSNPEIPRVSVVRQGGRTYVAAWAHGQQKGDALTKSQEVVQVGLYAMDASGASVAPLHRVSVPVTARGGTVKAYDGGDGLVIAWRDTVGPRSVSVDAATGKVATYDNPAGLVPECPSACISGQVVAVTSKGPLAANSLGGFGVAGGWASQNIAPKGADAGKIPKGGYVSGNVAGVRSGMFLAFWKAADGSDTRIWSAHDLESGRLLASTTCGEQGTDSLADAVASPNGRYLALDSVVFDVKAGRGLCLQGDDTRRTVEIRSLTDDGTAYGETDADSGAKSAVEVNVRGTTPKALPEGTLLPVGTPAGGGLFALRENGAGMRLSFRKES
jgi:hypothetical protein